MVRPQVGGGVVFNPTTARPASGSSSSTSNEVSGAFYTELLAGWAFPISARFSMAPQLGMGWASGAPPLRWNLGWGVFLKDRPGPWLWSSWLIGYTPSVVWSVDRQQLILGMRHALTLVTLGLFTFEAHVESLFGDRPIHSVRFCMGVDVGMLLSGLLRTRIIPSTRRRRKRRSH